MRLGVKRLLLLLLASATVAAAEPQKVAFERNGDSVWVCNLDGSGARKIAAGVDPDISPDGTRLAFNTEQRTASTRRIAVADLKTGAVKVFKDLPSDNCFGPVWSPDGRRLVFYILLDENWNLGVANADGIGFRVLKKGEPNDHDFWSACWTPDGRSLFCQDLENLYLISLDGPVIKQWPLQKLFAGGDMDSNVRFSVSPDGKTLLVELNSEAVPELKDWDGPAPTIWALDLATEKARQVTAQFWWEPRWISDYEFLCIHQGAREKEPSVYRVSADGKKRELVVRDATGPSATR